MPIIKRGIQEKHTFNRAAEQTIADALAICSQRGGEYRDSWSIDNLHTPYLDNLLKDHPAAPSKLVKEHRRLIVMASMIDIKISRMGGPWKLDTSIDLINYVGAYARLRSEFDDAVIASI